MEEIQSTDRMRKLSKIESVKRYLMTGKTLTPIQAINFWSYTRLADAINKLNNRGMNIKNLNKKGKYAKYKIEK